MPSNNDVTYPVRCSKELRDAYLAACKNNDRNGAQELREFMRQYVAKHGQVKLL